jgi:hypothetical protein
MGATSHSARLIHSDPKNASSYRQFFSLAISPKELGRSWIIEDETEKYFGQPSLWDAGRGTIPDEVKPQHVPASVFNSTERLFCVILKGHRFWKVTVSERSPFLKGHRFWKVTVF